MITGRLTTVLDAVTQSTHTQGDRGLSTYFRAILDGAVGKMTTWLEIRREGRRTVPYENYIKIRLPPLRRKFF